MCSRAARVDDLSLGALATATSPPRPYRAPPDGLSPGGLVIGTPTGTRWWAPRSALEGLQPDVLQGLHAVGLGVVLGLGGPATCRRGPLRCARRRSRSPPEGLQPDEQFGGGDLRFRRAQPRRAWNMSSTSSWMRSAAVVLSPGGLATSRSRGGGRCRGEPCSVLEGWQPEEGVENVANLTAVLSPEGLATRQPPTRRARSAGRAQPWRACNISRTVVVRRDFMTSCSALEGLQRGLVAGPLAVTSCSAPEGLQPTELPAVLAAITGRAQPWRACNPPSSCTARCPTRVVLSPGGFATPRVRQGPAAPPGSCSALEGGPVG